MYLFPRQALLLKAHQQIVFLLRILEAPALSLSLVGRVMVAGIHTIQSQSRKLLRDIKGPTCRITFGVGAMTCRRICLGLALSRLT